MVSVMQLSKNLKDYLVSQVDVLSSSAPMVGFVKPLIIRALDKNMSKIHNAVDLIADKDGNVDIENILAEMLDNVSSMKPFSFNTSFMGDIEIGGGQVKLNVPFINRRLVLNQTDLETLRDMLTTKN